MTENQRALGVGTPLVVNGQAYTVSPLTNADYCQFEAWLEEQAWAGVARIKSRVVAAASAGDAARLSAAAARAVYDDAVAQVSRDVATQQYAYGSELFQNATVTVPGLAVLLRLSVQRDSPDFDQEAADAIVRDNFELVANKLNETNWKGKV